MSDLVERLKAHDLDVATGDPRSDDFLYNWADTADALMIEAVAEITRLRAAIAAMPRLEGETVERVALEMRERCARVAETGSGWISEYHRHGGVPSVMIATAIRALPASTPIKEESA